MLISALGCDMLCAARRRRLICLPELSTSYMNSIIGSERMKNTIQSQTFIFQEVYRVQLRHVHGQHAQQVSNDYTYKFPSK